MSFRAVVWVQTNPKSKGTWEPIDGSPAFETLDQASWSLGCRMQKWLTANERVGVAVLHKEKLKLVHEGVKNVASVASQETVVEV